MKYRFPLALLILVLPVFLYSQEIYQREIDWEGIQKYVFSPEEDLYQIYFDGAVYNPRMPGVPFYEERFPWSDQGYEPLVRLVDATFAPLEGKFLDQVPGLHNIGTQIEITSRVVYDRKKPSAFISFIPIRKNPANGTYEQLVSFGIQMRVSQTPVKEQKPRSFKNNSVLATGDWYKIAVNKTGVHKLTYNELSNMGISPGSIDPRDIRIYGNGGGMLPEKLSGFRYDDLMENAIQVVGEDDGVFNQGDYILFYGESPDTWKWSASDEVFYHEKNDFSDYTYYFITADLGRGKRIKNQSQVTLPADYTSEFFTDHQFHEEDEVNIAQTGRTWYDSPPFDVVTSHSYDFSFPYIDVNTPVYIRSSVAARSFSPSAFRFYANGDQVMSLSVDNVSGSAYSAYAKSRTGSTMFAQGNPDISIRLEYNKTSSGATGWLDYIELNARRKLSFHGPQMAFRDPLSAVPGSVTDFIMSNAESNVSVWNVTDPLDVRNVNYSLSGNTLSFRLSTDSLLQFAAFNGSSYYGALFIEKVENQNLHMLDPYDMVIVSHPAFLAEAGRLAAHHQGHDGLSVFVTTPGKIYNEFSSGAQDVSAIRDFMKMLYDRGRNGNEPMYLLMFGDASYDYKNRIEDNTNLVPTWVDPYSLNIISSISTDDFYGFLDDGEGTMGGAQLIDIGIGRFPVTNVEQARMAVDKVIHYAAADASVMGPWRNFLTFVADDEDGNMHMASHAEKMARKIDTTYRVYNIDKIYVDAYPQEATPGGQRAPGVNEAINRRMDKGTLIMNYTGHGGEVGWAHERILEISDINGWTNMDKLAVFVTATCEFSRYDDPERTSAGELTFLNPAGGTVGLFTTARATYGSSNFNLNSALFDCVFEKNNEGDYPRFGDIIRQSKNKSGSVTENDLKFILLGDPALRLAYPEHTAVTTSISDDHNSPVDTLKALKKITIEGEIQDQAGTLLDGYNGILYPLVYDKPTKVKTLGTDPSSYVYTFELRNSVLYKGKASVVNGKFRFSFIVPKDIAYQFGHGKISYYAHNDGTDAAGYDEDIIVGGYESGGAEDKDGPDIELYLNDEGFVFGGLTDESPLMLAYIHDTSGVNTVGSGIGHDIVAVLDKNTDKSINLNDYYESDLDSYTSGSVRYPFSGLKEGAHTLSLKVWDVYNNSSESYLEFVVAESAGLALDHVLNYPNPFTTRTEFFFEHNQPGSTLEVLLQVFTVSGKLVFTYNDMLTTAGFRAGPIPPHGWNGRDDFGDQLARGVYLYKLSVRTMDGSYADKLEKLVILK
ncbi:MAG: type IX secretion system sortase PorU [Bacteroidales bacterium]